MGFFDRWRARQTMIDTATQHKNSPAVGIGGSQEDEVVTMTFNDKNITFSGSLAGYDYDSI